MDEESREPALSGSGILVVNAGSSTIKLALVEEGRAVQAVELPVPADEGFREAIEAAVDGWAAPQAVAHRIVHPGAGLAVSSRLDPSVRSQLQGGAELAPLHTGLALRAIDCLLDLHPEVPQVACLDSAFHSTLPAAASVYPLPREWRQRFGVRRLGFHGFSHAHASRRASEMLGRPLERLRTVTCHLGAGASLAAVSAGRSVDTTMGFTPNEGLVMATRSGSVDPGALLWLVQRGGLPAREVELALERESGLTGLAGTADMREVLERSAAGDGPASTALGVYLHRLRGSIAAMAAAMGGLDALVFTGGVGERSPEIRRGACEGLGFLGVLLDPLKDGPGSGDAELGADGAEVAVLRVAAREDLELAREARRVLSRGA